MNVDGVNGCFEVSLYLEIAGEKKKSFLFAKRIDCTQVMEQDSNG